MRFLLFLVLLLPTAALSDKVLSYEIKPGVKVFLAETKCQLPYNKSYNNGKAALVQNSTGQFVKGCWYLTDDKKFYHIDWSNPKAPGDFAELEIGLFNKEDI